MINTPTLSVLPGQVNQDPVDVSIRNTLLKRPSLRASESRVP
jgi:hypothetical protein